MSSCTLMSLLLVFVLCFATQHYANAECCTLCTEQDCPANWLDFNGNCYLFVNEKKTWNDASIYCNTLKAQLVSIHSDDENTRVNQLTGSARSWIGLHDKHGEGTFVWTDGTDFDYNKWGYSEPNNAYSGEDCTEIYPSSHWNDMPCTTDTQPFTCKMAKA